MKRFKKCFGPWVFTTALVTLLVGTGSAGAASASQVRAASCVNRIVPSPSPGASDNHLSGITTVAVNNVWAAGEYLDENTGLETTLIEQWNGTQWSVVSSPNFPSANNYLNSISADSANDIWAVGDESYSYANSIIEHWDGTKWSLVSNPNPGSGFNYLNGVDAISPTNVWAVGEQITKGYTQDDTLIEHWDGTQWSVIASPNSGAEENALDSVAAVSATDIWAVGNYFNTTDHNQTLTEHWDGTSWNVVSSPTIGAFANFLRGVSPVSTNDVWAVGFYWASPGNITDTLTEHWDGSSWSVVSSPNPPGGDNFLGGVFALTADSVWTVGSTFSGTLVIKWDGTAWTIIPSPGSGGSSLLAISGLFKNRASQGVLWAAGFDGHQTLIERLCL